MKPREQEQRAIDLVLGALNHVEGTSHQVERRPDRLNREAAEVDAYAEGPGAPPLAIEHTRLETFAGQARDDAWFLEALGSLEGLELPCLLRLYPPHVNVGPGQDWKGICARIRSWAIESASSLPEGVSTHEIPGVPFLVLVEKVSDGERVMRIGRMEPAGDRAEQLLATMDAALDHKAQALERYRRQGAVAVLVLESEDVALTHEGEIYLALLRVTRQRPRPWLDQVWLVRTVTGERPYCLLGPDELMAAANPENLRFGRAFEEMWLQNAGR